MSNYIVVRENSTSGPWIAEGPLDDAATREALIRSKADIDDAYDSRAVAEDRAATLNERDAADERGECTCDEDGQCWRCAQIMTARRASRSRS